MPNAAAFGIVRPRKKEAIKGWMAEWLCSGLQLRVRRFDSDPSLHLNLRFKCTLKKTSLTFD